MARLRDARTSEIVFEGTPVECVVHARELGGATVAPMLDAGEEIWDCPTDLIYDDVGLDFDPDAVLQGAEEQATGLEALAADPDVEDAYRDRVEEAARSANAKLEADPASLDAAKAALERAHKRQDEAIAAEG